ncbi:porin family protein [Marinigracilibium pacificum]|uniref:PorT family protein n=1 Tax=Marinigracilibium pacificum TaxID=2729599 RepID=A0A848J0V6_9BACT|nr:porin family protein [Marinigracilibium pacificum]NMM48114.1 PorT family protein [Marinigracilibium pacificum]
MKIRHILGLAFALAITFGANAQEFGIRAGINSSTMRGNHLKYSVAHIGYHIGGTAILPISENIKINGSAMLTQKGIRDKGYSYAFDLNYTDKEVINYLEIPVAIEYGFDGGNMKPYFQAGLYLAYAVSGKFVQNNENEKIIENLDFGNNSEDHYSAADFGFTFGTGVDINKLRIGVSYDLGVNDIQPAEIKDNQDSNDPYSIKNRSFNVNVSYFFNR